jgi:predicted methyltransferase
MKMFNFKKINQMKLTLDIPNTTNLEQIIAYLVGEGVIVTDYARKKAVQAQREQELLAGVREGMRLLAAKCQGKTITLQSANDLLNELGGNVR